jgi:hypothetical protein
MTYALNTGILTQYQAKTEPIAPSLLPDSNESMWHQGWVDPTRRAITAAIIAPVFAFVSVVTTVEIVTVDKWFHELSKPVRLRPDIGAPRQQAFFAEPFSLTQPESVLYSKFGYPWSEPVRVKPRLREGLQQSLAFHPTPSPFVASGWFNWLNEPVRIKPRLLEGRQQFFIYGNQKPLVSFGWEQRLTEPVRVKPSLKTALQQFDALQVPVLPTPVGLLEGWYNWWSEPVRLPIGLRAWLQQTTAMPSRLLPPIDVTGTMDAVEQGDIFTAGGTFWNQIASGEVGIIEMPPGNIRAMPPGTEFTGQQRQAYSGIIENAQVSANVGEVAEITATQSGSAVPLIVSARVSIRIV